MRDPVDAATANRFPAPEAAKKGDAGQLVQRAPGPEAPDTRTRAGAQRGMIIILVGGGAFWLAVAGLAIWLLR